MKRHQQQSQNKPPQPPPMRSSQPLRRRSEATVSLGTPVWIRPLAMLAGAWIVVVMVALLAVSGLLSPDSSSGNHINGATIARSRAETAQLAQHQSRLPLWLFGAIALSCGAGCILVSKQAARPPRARARSQRKIAPQHLNPSLAPIAPEPLLESSFQSIPSTPAPAPATVPSFALAPRHAQTRHAQAEPTTVNAPVTLIQLAQMQLNQAGVVAVGPPASVPVTVVPHGEKAPLDWGEASLADKLDLRKRRSASSLL